MANGLPKREHIEVRDIVFAYNNYQVINVLKQRGTAIANCQWDSVKTYDEKLTKIVKNPANYERLTRPVCAFITLESDDGQAEAINYTKRLRYNRHRNQK